MKKNVLILSIVLFTASMFIGCSSDNNETDSNLPTETPTQPPTTQPPTTNTVAKFTELYNFKGYNSSSLIYSSGFIYGVSRNGVYSIKTDGTAYTLLYAFSNYSNSAGSLLLNNGVLYGMIGNNRIYKLNIDGSNYKELHLFSSNNPNDGSLPCGSLVISGNKLYGMTTSGGNVRYDYGGLGTIFEINTDGTNFKILHHFGTTGDGSYPYGSLLLNNGALYGMTYGKGSLSNGYGNIFKINVDGTNYTNLHQFTGGKDGGNTSGSLIIDGNTLYGLTPIGGKIVSYTYGGNQYSNGGGNIFKINTDGSGFSNLLEFEGGMSSGGRYGSLTQVGNVLYGVHVKGLYSLKTDGTGYAFYDSNLWMGTFSTDKSKNGNLIFDGKSFYDVIRSGDGDKEGTLYKFDPPTIK